MGFPILVACVLALFLGEAQAQSVCNMRPVFLEQLKQRHHESPVGIGLAANGTVMEVLASEKGSWTIITTRPDGVTCLVASGEHWEAIAPAETPGL